MFDEYYILYEGSEPAKRSPQVVRYDAGFHASHTFSSSSEFIYASERAHEMKNTVCRSQDQSFVFRTAKAYNEQCRDLVVPILDRMGLTEIEFIAVLVLALWSMSENISLFPNRHRISKKNTK